MKNSIFCLFFFHSSPGTSKICHGLTYLLLVKPNLKKVSRAIVKMHSQRGGKHRTDICVEAELPTHLSPWTWCRICTFSSLHKATTKYPPPLSCFRPAYYPLPTTKKHIHNFRGHNNRKQPCVIVRTWGLQEYNISGLFCLGSGVKEWELILVEEVISSTE